MIPRLIRPTSQSPLTLTKYVSHTLASCRNDEYAAAVIPLNIETHSRVEGSVLIAEADCRVRLEGTKFALVGGPTPDLLPRIEKIELDNGLPHPTLGGVWARNSREMMKSYLFVDLTEGTTDAMIDYAKAGGFGYIVVYDGVWKCLPRQLSGSPQEFSPWRGRTEGGQ